MTRWAAGGGGGGGGVELAGTGQEPVTVGATAQLGVGTAAARWDHGHVGSKPIGVRAARITSGGFNPLPNTSGSWSALTGFELSIPAATGEWVEANADFMMTTGGGAFLDLAVIVGSSLVRFGATGTSSPALEGNPGWYPVSGYSPGAASVGFTVTSGDLDSGNVRFVLACKGNGTGRLFADTNYPFRWRALNLRTVV